MEDSPPLAMEALYQDAILLWMNECFFFKKKKKKKTIFGKIRYFAT